MASKDQHLQKAQSNQAFLDTLDDRFPDWLVVVAFYKGVHLVEAMFAQLGHHSTRHADRNDRLKRDHPSIWREFKPLYDVSRQVRYDLGVVSAENVRKVLIGQRLARVEQMVTAKISAAAKKAASAKKS